MYMAKFHTVVLGALGITGVEPPKTSNKLASIPLIIFGFSEFVDIFASLGWEEVGKSRSKRFGVPFDAFKFTAITGNDWILTAFGGHSYVLSSPIGLSLKEPEITVHKGILSKIPALNASQSGSSNCKNSHALCWTSR